MKQETFEPDLNRRDFMKTGSVAAIIAAMGGVPITAQEADSAAEGILPVPKADPNYKEKPPAPPLSFGVIGLGAQGRHIVDILTGLPNAPVVALCDNYRAAFRRAAAAAPEATQYADYKELLADPKVQAVVITTPTHLHREIALEALQSGKHVYLEAPIAHTLEDARAIAKAASQIPETQIFQVGLQFRENPQHHHVAKFIRSGATGQLSMSRGQWNQKTSWVRPSPSPDRGEALNWRLQGDVSLGLAGEVGIHSMDVARWFFNQNPTAVSGFGSLVQWLDGRDVADTITSVVEFPNSLRHVYNATLTNSFEGENDVFYGSDSAVLLRDNRAWMFKESDAPLLGWEVYARKDEFLNESGIALVANATQILAQGKKPAEAASDIDDPVRYAFERFIEYAAEGTMPVANWRAGLEATVLAIKAQEAIVTGKRIVLNPEWIDV